MTGLIQITQTQINGSEVNSVNAKELHTALGLKSQFANWIKKQKEVLETYEEGVDYIRTTKDRNNLSVTVKADLNLNGKECDYILSLDMAKHLSLMSKSKKGKEVRKYFIEAEKQTTALMSPNQITEALALTAQSLTLQDERIDMHHERIQEVELYIQNEIELRPVDHAQQSTLLSVRHKKVFELAEVYGKDKGDKELIRKLYAKIGSLFKKQFSIPRYNSLPSSKFNDGIAFLNAISLKDMA